MEEKVIKGLVELIMKEVLNFERHAVKSVAIATHAGVFASMLGHWSYASDASSIQTTKWQGLHLIVR